MSNFIVTIYIRCIFSLANHTLLYNIFKTKNNELAIFGKTLDDVKNKFISFIDVYEQYGLKGENGALSYLFGNKNSGNIITSELLDEFETFKDLFNSSSMSAEALAESLGGVDDRILNYAKTCKNGEMTTQGFKTSLEGMTLSAKAGQVALKGLAMVGNMLAFWAISEGIQFLSKTIKGLNNDCENLENKISKLESTYDEQTQSIDDINSKLEENKQKIDDILKLENPTYVDLQDLENLRTQNALLKENLGLKEKAKNATNQEILDSLDEELNKTFFTNDANLENATKLDSSEDYFKNIFTLGGYNIYQSQKYYNEDSEYEKIKNSIEELEKYKQLKEEAYKNNGVATNKITIGNTTLEAQLTTDDIERAIADYEEELENYSTTILSLLDKRMTYDPNNESSNSKFLLNLNDQIIKLLDFDTFTNTTIEKAIADNRFNEIGEKIKEDINNGIISNEEDLLSYKEAEKIIRYISSTLYGAINDDSLKKTASYIIKYFGVKVESEGAGISSFLEAFNSTDFSESKEKLLELAKAGELSVDILNDKYSDFLKNTGLLADEAYKKIMNLISVNDRFADMSSDMSKLSTAYKEFKENNFITAETLDSLEKFKKLSSYKQFTLITGDKNTSKKEKQNAFNTLATEYLAEEAALSKLNETNKDYHITQLKDLGIKNAKSVVENALIEKEKAANLQTKYRKENNEELFGVYDKLINATDEEKESVIENTQKFLELNEATSGVRYQLLLLNAEEDIFKNKDLNVDAKVEQLLTLAETYGILGEIVTSLGVNEDEHWRDPLTHFTELDLDDLRKVMYEKIYGSKFEGTDKDKSSSSSSSSAGSSAKKALTAAINCSIFVIRLPSEEGTGRGKPHATICARSSSVTSVCVPSSHIASISPNSLHFSAVSHLASFIHSAQSVASLPVRSA